MKCFGIVVVAIFSFGFVGGCAHQAPPKPQSLAQGPALPILAWGGIPYDKATDERYAELAEDGFTINYSGAADAAMMEKLLALGQKHGIRQMISFPALKTDPEGTAKRFKDVPGVAGYYLRDEPGAKLFPELAAWAKKIQSVDSTNPCYVNMLPTYGIPAQWETPDYPTYLQKFIKEVPVPMVSWDHYPVIRTGADASTDQLRGDFYQNLELCSAAARKAGRPVWAFVLSVGHISYPMPEVTHMRVQAFSDLAYGGQVIEYFTYWTSPSSTWNFHDAPIAQDGTRTPTYERVKQVNAEIQALRGVFLGSTVVSVGHTGQNIPTGTTRFVAVKPIKSLDTPGGGGVVSILSRGDHRFLVVVNRDLHHPMPLRVAFEPNAHVRPVAKDGTIGSIKDNLSEVSLDPGDLAVYTWDSKSH